MKILVVGSGFLGTKLIEKFSKNHEVISAGVSGIEDFVLDANNASEVKKFISEHKPKIVVDTVALTSSLKCENDPELAYKLNYLTAKNISEACVENDSWLIFMSSSYLFDGKKGNYSETDIPTPMNEYAKTKILAEKELLKNSKAIILRVDLLLGFNGKNKPNGVFDQILSGKQISIREPNQLRKPLFVDDVSGIILNLIKKNKHGIFHLANPTRIKMFDLLKSLEKLIRNDSKIVVSAEESPTKIKIPFNATLDISKISCLGIKTTPLEKALNKMKKQLENENI